MHRTSIGQGDWLQLNGPINLFQTDSIAFRYADARAPAARRARRWPAIDLRQDSITGPVIATANLTSTGGTATWSTMTRADHERRERARTSCS